LIKVRPVRDVVFQENKKKMNGHTDGRNKMEIKGAVGNCFTNVRKMSQTLSGKTNNISINFNLAGTIHCW
jgi:hypothetical protein